MFVIHFVFRSQVKIFFLHLLDGVPDFAIFDQDFNKIIKKNRICNAVDVIPFWLKFVWASSQVFKNSKSFQCLKCNKKSKFSLKYP